MPSKFEDNTTYKNDFSVYKDNTLNMNDSIKRKENRDKMRKGTLTSSK